ncbi:MAG: hypothetical protein A2Z88_11520 [Omnitrophica WOR_2 bacterium GWA2_47_8]|nr:MAG: hypothetical protein A2Z88_11520 [Omnitrophica WOR_2 bacterium GWA2_47_8]
MEFRKNHKSQITNDKLQGAGDARRGIPVAATYVRTTGISSGRTRAQRAFTTIELVMVILILGILAVPGAYILGNVVRNSIYVPNKLNMDMLAADALDIMIEGDNQFKGLRFCRSIITAQDNQVIFINQNNQQITYQLDTINNRLNRIDNIGDVDTIPYYIASGVSVLSNGPRLFTYYDANEAVTNTAANVRRIVISLIARTGNGSYNSWEGESQQTVSIAVKRLQ